jgi:methyl-accepting chemotaxis protein
MLGRGVKLTETFASGNLTYKISDEDLKLRDEMGDLNRALSAMGNKLNVIVSDIVNGAIAVASAGQQINSTTLQLSHGANEQASTVEEVSSSMEQMVSSIQMNADNALQTEKIAQITVEEVRNLSEISEKSLESVRKISGKIGIINDIAFQTNILALNAAVEAARAGENGKGFAVVASEVRKLAELSKSAANEIMLLSQGSLNNTEAAVAQMLHLIPEIEKIAQLIREMAASNKEQSSGSDLINSAIQQLNTITQQNAAASEELASGVDGLSNQADHLRDVVAFFKIDESKKV